MSHVSRLTRALALPGPLPRHPQGRNGRDHFATEVLLQLLRASSMALILALQWSCAAEAPPEWEWGVDAGGAGAIDAEPPDSCYDVDCGPHGDCVDIGDGPLCQCDDGYHAQGYYCVPDTEPDPCDDVTCGANAHCDEGLCECDFGFEGNPNQGCEEITPEQMARAELVEIAWAELGFCEGVESRPYMWDQPGYWCYDFVEWVYDESSYDIPEPYELTKYYTWALPDGWRPEPGDLIKFHIQHYGMVAEVSADGRTITTIEGNYSRCVKSRDITDSSVSYYGTLDNVF
jgi:hypothetical protein